MKTLRNPEAYISIGKNRQKAHEGEYVYLKNNQEFSFEFFNPTQENILATITLNGKKISNNGLVLRPGQRGWIERYIDEKRKFLFETYEVGNSKTAKKATELNGKVEIKFYKEKQKPINSGDMIWLTEGRYELGPNTAGNYFAAGGYVHTTRTNYNNFINGQTLTNCTGSCSATLDSCSFSSPLNSRKISAKSSTPTKSIKRSKKTETGRVEKGDTSNQAFDYVDIQFESYHFYKVNYKLLPISEKKNYLEDIKLKCQECGMKLKKNWKVCPVCTCEINEQGVCRKCGEELEFRWKVCPECGTKI